MMLFIFQVYWLVFNLVEWQIQGILSEKNKVKLIFESLNFSFNFITNSTLTIIDAT